MKRALFPLMSLTVLDSLIAVCYFLCHRPGTVFWLLAVCIQTPVFSVGIGLASVVPSILAINTKLWFVYPMAYPFFVVTAEYGKLAENLTTSQVELVPWLPAAAGITVVCLLVSCVRFGQAERR